MFPTKPIVANIVATIDLGIKLDLNTLIQKYPDIVCYPKKFAAGILKIKEPIRVTFLIWKSGKIVCLGTKNLIDCERVLKEFVHKIQSLGYKEANFSRCNIQNLVSSFDWGKKLDLGELRKRYPKDSFYEPEIFCGLHFKIHPRIVCLVFASGKVVITGSKDLDEIDFMYKKIKKYLL